MPCTGNFHGVPHHLFCLLISNTPSQSLTMKKPNYNSREHQYTSSGGWGNGLWFRNNASLAVVTRFITTSTFVANGYVWVPFFTMIHRLMRRLSLAGMAKHWWLSNLGIMIWIFSWICGRQFDGDGGASAHDAELVLITSFTTNSFFANGTILPEAILTYFSVGDRPPSESAKYISACLFLASRNLLPVKVYYWKERCAPTKSASRRQYQWEKFHNDTLANCRMHMRMRVVPSKVSADAVWGNLVGKSMENTEKQLSLK